MSERRPPEVDLAAAARAERARRAARRARIDARFRRAQEDADRIIRMIGRLHRPRRIHQWGSLVNPEHFSELSDIDIALEGLEGGEPEMAVIRDAAEPMTTLHLDLVEMEKLDPGRASLIRRFGRVVWEREGHA